MLNLKTVIPVCALFLASCGNEPEEPWTQPEEPWTQEGFDDFTICVDNEINFLFGEQIDYEFVKKFSFIDRLVHSLTSTGPMEDVTNAFANCIVQHELNNEDLTILRRRIKNTREALFSRGAPENARK